VFERFVNKGIGNINSIGHGIAIASRYNELECDFRASNLQIPAILIDDLFESGTLEFGETLLKKVSTDCDPRIIKHLLNRSSQGAKELIMRLKTERSYREQKVQSLMTTWELDKGDIAKNRMVFSRLRRDLESFSVNNVGDAESILFRFVLNEELQNNHLPTESRYTSKTVFMKERFETCLLDGNGKESIDALVWQLRDEERARRQTLLEIATEAIARDSNIDIPQELPMDLQKILLDLPIAKENIMFGTISVLDAIRSIIKVVRKHALEAALENAVPLLLYKSRRSRTLYDLRCGEFIDGLRSETAEVLVSTWQVDAHHRQEEIRRLLQTEGFSLEHLNDNNLTDTYHKYMQGADCISTAAIASEIAQEIRRSEIRCELKNTDLEDFWMAEEKSPPLNDFVYGRSFHLSAKDAVAAMIHERHNRKQKLAEMMRDSNLEQANYKYDVTTAIKKYFNEGKLTAGWIVSACSHFSRRKVCVEAFGKLSSILPEFQFEEVTEQRDAMETFILNKPPPAMLCLDLESRQLIMSYVSFDDVINFSLYPDLDSGSDSGLEGESHDLPPEGESLASSSSSAASSAASSDGNYYTENTLDKRLILLVTNHPDCPWENAVQAVAALRLERAQRIQRFDEIFPRYKEEKMDRWGPTMTSLFNNETKQDQEDGILRNYDLRANFINGNISMDIAIKHFTKKKNKTLLEGALSDAVLFNGLVEKDKRCQTYIKTLEFENASKSLSMLITSLQEEKSVRHLLLEGAFCAAGITDTGVGITSVMMSGIEDDLEFGLYGGDADLYDFDSFPSETEVAFARNSYIH